MKAVVTGAGGSIGSACVRELAYSGWEVVGVDIGKQGSIHPVLVELVRTVPGFRNLALDIRDQQGVCDLFEKERPNFIIHTAAQPSQDKTATIPYEDFDTVGALKLLVAARDWYFPEWKIEHPVSAIMEEIANRHLAMCRGRSAHLALASAF